MDDFKLHFEISRTIHQITNNHRDESHRMNFEVILIKLEYEG